MPVKRRQPTLALCMIVCDEADYLEACLRSVADLVDELVVVDTGSQDATPRIAREWGARIVPFAWCDDFAAARNCGLAHCRADWVFYLDADERLEPDSRSELQAALVQEATLVSVRIESPGPQAGQMHLSRSHRLFRRLPGVRFHGRIHEQIAPSIPAALYREYRSGIRIHHLGYAKPPEEMAEKRARNRRLLRFQLAEEPEHFYWHYCLGQDHMLSGEWVEAAEVLQAALRAENVPPDIRASIHANLAEIHLHLGHLDRAEEEARRSLAIAPQQVAAHLLLYQAATALNDSERQRLSLEAALETAENLPLEGSGNAVDAYVEPTALRLRLAHLYREGGRLQEAERRYQHVLHAAPDCLEAELGLIDCALAAQRYSDAYQRLRHAVERAPDDPGLMARLAYTSLKLKRLPEAVGYYTALLRREPQNPNLRRRVAGLLNRLGQRDQARRILQGHPVDENLAPPIL